MISRLLIGPVLLLGLLGGCDRHNAAGEQAAAPAPAAAVTPAPPGSIDRSHKGEAAPGVAFADPSGKPVTLAAFRGRPVLVNLWATWCGPCVKEMPTLDALAATFPVAAVAQDTARAPVVAYLAHARLARIKPYVDPQTGLSVAYQASLPTSILLDSTGHEVWRTAGAMDWTGAQARALLAEAR